jgi:hypothetical protein
MSLISKPIAGVRMASRAATHSDLVVARSRQHDGGPLGPSGGGARQCSRLLTGSKKLGMSEYAQRFAENDIEFYDPQ